MLEIRTIPHLEHGYPLLRDLLELGIPAFLAGADLNRVPGELPCLGVGGGHVQYVLPGVLAVVALPGSEGYTDDLSSHLTTFRGESEA